MSMVAAGVAAGPAAEAEVEAEVEADAEAEPGAAAVLCVGVAANCEDAAEPEGAGVGGTVGEPAAATADESKGIQIRQ